MLSGRRGDQGLFIDCPYVNPTVHFSATLAALLSCVCRYAILGHVPLFAVRSTTYHPWQWQRETD
jgi:hypothetical protein